MPSRFEAFFLDASPGQRFCLFYPPDGREAARGAVVYVHPFAEELNRSRRMAALQARTLAAAGYAVLQIDLYGCGDSSGDFGEATWDAWGDDVVRACAWLLSRVDAPLWIWGLRAGCLVGAAAAARLKRLEGFIFWQPVFSGHQCLQQFLRLKLAGDIVNGQDSRGTDSLRQLLGRGEAVEITGYALSPALAAGLEDANLTVPARSCRIQCLEISGGADSQLSPAMRARMDEWIGAGHAVRAAAVSGPAFWQTAEITENQALVQATLAALEDCPP